MNWLSSAAFTSLLIEAILLSLPTTIVQRADVTPRFKTNSLPSTSRVISPPSFSGCLPVKTATVDWLAVSQCDRLGFASRNRLVARDPMHHRDTGAGIGHRFKSSLSTKRLAAGVTA